MRDIVVTRCLATTFFYTPTARRAFGAFCPFIATVHHFYLTVRTNYYFQHSLESLNLRSMKPTNYLVSCLGVFACAVMISTSATFAAIKPTEAEAKPLPEIWEKAGPRERLKATRAAELDGDRLLVERIFGLQVDGETTVGDLALEEDVIGGAVQATLVGAVSAEEPEYLPDGRVQVVRAVKIREVVDRLNRVLKGKRLSDGSFNTISDKTKTDRTTNDKIIDVMGNAALPNTEGHEKVMSKRAAEVDAYRRLAGRMMGVKITSDSTVRDMCLENDQIVASLSQVLKAATPTDIKYKSDGTCEVTLEVKVEDVIRTTKRYLKGGKETVNISDEIETKTFTETGIGTMRPAEEGGEQVPAGTTAMAEISGGGNEPFFEAKVVIKEVVQSGPVVQ